MGVGADRVRLVDTTKLAACIGIDGTCLVSLVERRARALSGSNDATLDLSREYTFGSSPNANVSVSDMVASGIASFGGNISTATTTELSATMTVSTMGDASGSTLDDAFAANIVFDQQLSLRLPGVQIIVSEPVVLRPPTPPPPPLEPPPMPPLEPQPSNATDGSSNGAAAGMSVIVAMLLLLMMAATCFIVGHLAGLRRAKIKRVSTVVPHNVLAPRPSQSRVPHLDDTPPEDAAADESPSPTSERERSRSWRTPTKPTRQDTLAAMGANDPAYPAQPPPPATGAPPAATKGGLLSTLLDEESPAEEASDRMSSATDRLSAAEEKPMLKRTPSRLAPVLQKSSTSAALVDVGAGPSELSADTLPRSATTAACQTAAKMRAVAAAQRLATRQQAQAAAIPEERLSMSGSSSGPGRFAPVLAPGQNAAARTKWQSLNERVNANMSKGKTMFDDGRFLKSVMDEARSNYSLGQSAAATPPPMLRKMSSGVAREPYFTELSDGVHGGGGVRLHPPHLEEADKEFAH